MIYDAILPTQRFLLLLAVSGLIITACASKPDRRGPERGERGERQQARASGTFMQPIGALFIGMDGNQDKVLTRPELEEGIANEWASFDGNPSATYFAQWSEKSLGATDVMPNFLSFDKDFSGVISKNEFSESLTRQFNSLDKNQDGKLERSEMLIAFQARFGGRRNGNGAGEQGRGRRGTGQGGGRGGRGGGGGGGRGRP